MAQRLSAVGILLVGILIGYFVYTSEAPEDRFEFQLGLDLSGGTQLMYRADTESLDEDDVEASLEALRDVIERRVNLFGVTEPLVQVERSSFVAGRGENRLIVELPGVTDVQEAIRLIGQTPLLEFKLRDESVTLPTPGSPETEQFDFNTLFKDTGLTGRLFSRAQLQFGTGSSGLSNEPIVSIEFNTEGAELFEKITRENTGKELGIFLDGVLISAPVIQEAIPNGRAVIQGSFTPDTARELVKNLNFGALPVPISLLSTQTIGPSLGEVALNRGIMAGIVGLSAVAAFMLLWYRLPGLIATLSLLFYVLIMLALFKIIPVTLTAAGLAAFILSIGMAVDANILIFERMKEELVRGKTLRDAMKEGFARAWLSIRDSNISSIITGIILYWMGGTAIIQGFALVFVIGVLVSMFTAISVSRTLLIASGMTKGEAKGMTRFLFGNGLTH